MSRAIAVLFAASNLGRGTSPLTTTTEQDKCGDSCACSATAPLESGSLTQPPSPEPSNISNLFKSDMPCASHWWNPTAASNEDCTCP